MKILFESPIEVEIIRAVLPSLMKEESLLENSTQLTINAFKFAEIIQNS